MNYHNSTHGPSSGGLGAPGSGFGNRSRLNSKRLSVALPPKVESISENQVDNPTPRTSRSHMLAGLRTQPRTPAAPASAPYHQTQHQTQGLNASKWANQSYNNYEQGIPQTATGAGFDYNNQYASNAGRQMYSLPEQVLAPPSVYEAEEMDPAVLQQMQMTSVYLAQRQQQLQQQLANITASAQSMSLDGNMQQNAYQQAQLAVQNAQGMYGQQMQTPMEVPGQPGVYLVYNPSTQGYSYAVDHEAQRQAAMSPQKSHQSAYYNSPPSFDAPAPSVSVSPPGTERSTPVNTRSFTPPKKASPPRSALEHVEPLPPPSATAFRRGHKKSSSLAINPNASVADGGPKTASTAVQGSQRSMVPPGPMTGTFGPGAARSGEHPMRQPRGPPPLEELTSAPTSKHEGSKNFSTRQRRRAIDNLVRAGSSRRGVSRSSSGSPIEPTDSLYSLSDEGEELASVGSNPSRKMSPIGYEMQQKRGSQGSADGYFGLSSASSSEGEDTGAFKQPSTPATPSQEGGADRKKMMLGVLNAAEKRRSFAL